MTISAIPALFLGITACISSLQQVSLPSNGADEPGSNAAGPPMVGQEQVPADEADSIQRIVALQLAIMRATDATKRGQHPKHHGFLDAEFIVNGEIPAQYKHGLFASPGSYKSKIRVSNATTKDDTVQDVHGLAIKVYGVKGARALEAYQKEEQDFIFIDGESFFAADPKAMLGFLSAKSSTDPNAMKQFAMMDPQTVMRAAASRKAPPPSPLTIPYWSTVPYKLGDGAVKYRLTPSPENSKSDEKPTDPNGLRLAMVNHLTVDGKSAQFEFSLIPQDDPSKSPLEDASVPWKATPIPVATIKILPQIFDTPERMKEGEDASFDPWHALAEHRPLGGINRARKAIYPASYGLRRQSRGQ